MTARLAVLAVHGMGRTAPDFAEPLRRGLAAALGPARWAQVAFRPVYYQGELQASQERVFRAVRAVTSWDWLREFLLYGFSDAASLETRKQGVDSAYTRAQRHLRDALDAARETCGGGDAPVVIVAHSLGCQVVSNYLWDAQQRRPGAGVFAAPAEPDAPRGSAADRVRRGGTVRALVTTGCNIPIFVSGFDDIRAIAPPGPRFRWVNLYDPDDALGWPLAPLSASYASLVTDEPVNARGRSLWGWLTSATPASHERYWETPAVLSRVAALVSEALDA